MEAVIKNGLVLQKDFSFKKQDVVIDGKKITGFDSRVKGYERIDAENKLVLPGFTNAHVHMALGLARGLGEDMPLVEMFEKVLFPLEERLTDEQAYLGAMISGIEYIRSGCTSVNNIGKTWSKPVVRALDKLGLKGTMALALKDIELRSKERFKCEYLKENEELVKDLRKHPRLHGLFGLANEVEASQSLITEVKFLAKRYMTGVHVHVAENSMEKGYILHKTGKSSVGYLDELGVLNHETIAVHAVKVSSKDIDILSRSDALVVHCPTANLALKNGVAPIGEMIEKGVRLGIGVDDPVAAMNNNIIREMSRASLLQETLGVHLTPSQVVSLAIGEKAIVPGAEADLVVVDRGKTLGRNLLGQLVLGDLTVSSVFADGELLMDDSMFSRLDAGKVFDKASKASEELLDFL